MTLSKSKADIVTGEVMITVNKNHFNSIPNIFHCGGRPIYIVVERRRPVCKACRAAGQLSKACPGKNPEKQPQPSTSKETKEAGISPQIYKGPGEWTELVKKKGKSATLPTSSMFEMRQKSLRQKKAARTKQQILHQQKLQL